jgi:hypothetical protein
MTDTRQALAALMGLAAECAQRKPLRAFEDFTEATHIGHRQFGRAYERADEDVRMLAVRLRAVFDALAPALAAQPVAGAVAQPRNLLEQFDLDQSPDYRKGYEDGRRKGFEVGHRYAAPQTQAAPAPEPIEGCKQGAGRLQAQTEPSAQGEPVAWRCFHCDEVFIDREAAQDHFGVSLFDQPACHIDIQHVRWLEEQHRRNCDDDTEALRTIRGLAGEHETLRRRAEEQGYAQGLADARKHPEELGLTLASAPSTPPVVEAAPLTEDEIRRCYDEAHMGLNVVSELSDFSIRVARAIERAHGIAPKAAQPQEKP